MSEEYPHWKDALFGNNSALANLRCAIKYGVWHGVHAILALIFVPIVLLIKALEFVAKFAGPLKGPAFVVLESAMVMCETAWENKYVKKVGRGLLILFALAAVLVAALLLGIIVYNYPYIVAGVVIGMVVAVALIAAGIYAWDRFSIDDKKTHVAIRVRRAGEKATRTPGVRRVYGECPVHMDIEPKWFDRLVNALD